eukprot:68314-Amphidinium_carterae.1
MQIGTEFLLMLCITSETVPAGYHTERGKKVVRYTRMQEKPSNLNAKCVVWIVAVSGTAADYAPTILGNAMHSLQLMGVGNIQDLFGSLAVSLTW